jgi:hypothetical protein
MRSTNPRGCHAPMVGHRARRAPAPAERAAQPTAGLAAAWPVKRFRVKPNLAALVALHGGLGGGERRHG